MALPLRYNVRNVRVRWQLTLLAVGGIALVVAVFTVLMAMSAGFERALRTTGRPDNAIVVQRGSGSELTSAVPIADRNMIMVDDRVARDAGGKPLASWDWVIVIGLPRKSDDQPANVTLRAVTPSAFDVRGGIRIVEGRTFTPGLDEVIVGRKLLDRIKGLALGGDVKYQQKRFRIVGLFESAGGAFESEIWGDFDTFGAIFKRGAGSSSLVLRMKDKAAIPELDRWIRAQPQMQLQAVSERKYYEDQAGPLSRALRGLATFVALVMGVGAVFGAINTMYAIVSARTREIGTLRALGFSRRSVLFSFVTESVFLAALGGLLGCILALPANGVTSATGGANFSELAFAFRITPFALGIGIAFALVMGILGGLLPAFRAARMPITSALREA
jgi:putative ABC transport system permease protein